MPRKYYLTDVYPWYHYIFHPVKNIFFVLIYYMI